MSPSFSGPVGEENGKDGDYRLDAGTKLSIEIATGARKRKMTDNESDDEDTDINMAPVNDIYRARQQKKVMLK